MVIKCRELVLMVVVVVKVEEGEIERNGERPHGTMCGPVRGWMLVTSLEMRVKRVPHLSRRSARGALLLGALSLLAP